MFIILHQHVFPGVLDRIRKSNIRNYSIYLCQRILFSYYEYTGTNYDQDMAQIARDPLTQDWWKLTDPMQDPLESRKKGEWWALMDEVFHRDEKSGDAEKSKRIALCARIKGSSVNQATDSLKNAYSKQFKTSALKDIQSLSVFHKDGCLYCYLEFRRDGPDVGVPNILEGLKKKHGLNWDLMKEVFHTD